MGSGQGRAPPENPGLEVLERALQMLIRALVPDDEPDLTDLLAEIAIDYSTSPVNMVGKLARALAVLGLASEEPRLRWWRR